MAQQQQLTQAQLEAIRKAKNEQFMALSVENVALAQAQNGTQYQQGRTINYDSPILASAYATKVTIRHKLKATVTGTGASAGVVPTAGYPYSLVSNVSVTYGQVVAKFRPYIAKVIDMAEGYARTMHDATQGNKNAEIDALLRKVPTSFNADGDYDIVFDTDYELNQLHPASANGLLYIASSGVRLQTMLTMPSQVAKDNADPLDQAFETHGGASVSISGDVEVIISFRDNNSMTTRQNLELDLNGLPSIQCAQLSTLNNLAGSGSWNFVSLRNPYPTAKLITLVVDGKSATRLCDPAGIDGFTIQKADSMNNALLTYDSTTGGFVNYFKKNRDKYGQDFDPGVILFDFTTENIANVSSKTGGAYLNLTGDGYPSSRIGVKMLDVDNSVRTSRIETFAVILGEGIQTR